MADEWPSLQPGDYPPGTDVALKRQLEALNAIGKQARIAAGSYYLFLALTRDRQFIECVNRAQAAYGIRIVVGSLIRDLIINLASMFDQNSNATDLRRVLNALLHRDNDEISRNFHATYGGGYDRDAAKARLASYRKRLNSNNLARALHRIVDLRKQAVAHIDMEPEFTKGRPLIRDIDYVLAAACIIVCDAYLFGLGRKIDASQTRDICRRGAASFAGIIRNGLPSS